MPNKHWSLILKGTDLNLDPAAEPDHELFLVYGKGRPGIIRGMDMNNKVPDEYMIPIENLMNPRALDFHAENEFIYFADATSYLIGRQKIDGTERDTILKEGKPSLPVGEEPPLPVRVVWRDQTVASVD